ncbi:DivIVA domain-containing protein [Euzebya sp.]|uniref:DivIVA domain-containing protein n=1 Tax=Euzebya sp. TaxID=1971409 RepID=UPI0035127CF5
MIPIVCVSIVLAGLLVWALYAEVVPPRARFVPARLEPTLTGADIRRHDFPLVVAGYDPRWVDAHLRQIAAIHDHLRQTAGTSPPPTTTRDLAAAAAMEPHPPASVLDG